MDYYTFSTRSGNAWEAVERASSKLGLWNLPAWVQILPPRVTVRLWARAGLGMFAACPQACGQE